MKSLRERAEHVGDFVLPPAPEPPDPMEGYEPGDGDPELVPVRIAWLRVRRDVGSIAKSEQYKEKDRDTGQYKTTYSFRGVDTAVKAFGPVTLRHGVNVIPVEVEAAHRDTTSSRGNKMRECTVTVTWMIMGPMGDFMTAQSAGEALDTSDKGTAKAQSVALRVLLFGAGLIPTGESDPDLVQHDRGEAPVRPLDSYVQEIVDPNTSDGRLRQIHAELKQQGRLQSFVTNELGAEEHIGAVIQRVVQDRQVEAQRFPEGGQS